MLATSRSAASAPKTSSHRKLFFFCSNRISLEGPGTRGLYGELKLRALAHTWRSGLATPDMHIQRVCASTDAKNSPVDSNETFSHSFVHRQDQIRCWMIYTEHTSKRARVVRPDSKQSFLTWVKYSEYTAAKHSTAGLLPTCLAKLHQDDWKTITSIATPLPPSTASFQGLGRGQILGQCNETDFEQRQRPCRWW